MMMRTRLAFSFAAVLLGSRAAATNRLHVPVFSIEELNQGSRSEELADILATTGLLSVVGSPRDQASFQQSRRDGLLGFCECVLAEDANNNRGALHAVDGVDSAVLADGTKRTTIATATIGAHPLELPREAMDRCSAPTLDHMERMRDQVAWTSHAFVSALDRLLLANHNSEQWNDSEKALLRSSSGKSFHSLQSIVHASQNLEHFHVYEKAEEVPVSHHPIDKKTVLDLHTDAGLFLAFVPGKHCSSDDTDEDEDEDHGDFYVQHPDDGALQRVVFAPGSVGVMLGLGAEHWLQTSLPLKATRHAVRMEAGASRAWYGMMHTVPQDAIIQDFPQRTFADMRHSMVLEQRKQGAVYHDDDEILFDQVSIGCGASLPPLSASSAHHGDARIHRRRLGTVENGETCNNVTNFFCWMSCLDIPQADNAAAFLREGYSLYCLDPQVLSQTGGQVSKAYEECKGGFTHNAACLGSWEPTAPGVPAYSVVAEPDETFEEAFCYGGTSMYMDGFHWTDSVCVIYLFPQWVLSTAGSLVGASIGTLFFGIALEGVIWKRRHVVNSLQEGLTRLAVSSLFYGLQLTMGYLLMLVVMTYSGPLFMCVILGLMSGHFLFNAISMKARSQNTGNDKEKVVKSDCCEEDVCPCDGKVNQDCRPCSRAIGNTSDGGESKSFGDVDSIPDGSTPCCQHSL